MSKISKTICISLNERIYDDKRNMKKNNLQNRAVLIFMLAFLVSSCLKETAVPIESAFSIESSEDKTSPVAQDNLASVECCRGKDKSANHQG